jgi:hypothetical protein
MSPVGTEVSVRAALAVPPARVTEDALLAPAPGSAVPGRESADGLDGPAGRPRVAGVRSAGIKGRMSRIPFRLSSTWTNSSPSTAGSPTCRTLPVAPSGNCADLLMPTRTILPPASFRRTPSISTGIGAGARRRGGMRVILPPAADSGADSRRRGSANYLSRLCIDGQPGLRQAGYRCRLHRAGIQRPDGVPDPASAGPAMPGSLSQRFGGRPRRAGQRCGDPFQRAVVMSRRHEPGLES